MPDPPPQRRISLLGYLFRTCFPRGKFYKNLAVQYDRVSYVLFIFKVKVSLVQVLGASIPGP